MGKKKARVSYEFVPIPASIWAEDLAVTLGEMRLIGYIIRLTVASGGRPVRLTDDELMRGRKGANGERLDYGCGIRGVNNLREAKQRCEGRKWVKITADKHYILKLPIQFGRVSETDSSEVSETDSLATEVSVSDTLEVSETDSPGTEEAPESPAGYPKRIEKLSETDTPTKEDKRSKSTYQASSSSSAGVSPHSEPNGERSPEVAVDWDLEAEKLLNEHRGLVRGFFNGRAPDPYEKRDFQARIGALLEAGIEIGADVIRTGIEDARRVNAYTMHALLCGIEVAVRARAPKQLKRGEPRIERRERVRTDGTHATPERPAGRNGKSLTERARLAEEEYFGTDPDGAA